MNRVGLTFLYDHKAAPYIRALQRFGLEPIPMNSLLPAPSLAEVGGLVLSGGTDVNPARYGQAPHARTTPPDDARDRFESDLLMEAIDRDIPVLCICRGMQLLNVALGGTLHQHIERHEVRTGDPSKPIHEALVESRTRLSSVFGQMQVSVNSRHHQSVDVRRHNCMGGRSARGARPGFHSSKPLARTA